MAPSYSRVYIHKPSEINQARLSLKAQEKFSIKPFNWQLDAASAILQGKDVVLDVGTSCGKTLCFSLPLLTNETDIALIISPLSALMIDQVSRSPPSFPSFAVCSETLANGAEGIYRDIAAGKYRRVFVSPEKASSKEFHAAVLSKSTFYNKLRVIVVDEAHCVSEWGGSFRPDYAILGDIRGRIASNVPIMIASATLPSFVLGAVKEQLQISKSAVHIQLTNARPNIALSTRVMKHPEGTKADLRFTIPEGAKCAEDIPIQLVYTNSRVQCEDAADRIRDFLPDSISRRCVAFYHAKVGPKQKRDLEERLQRGEVRILVCTDAVGMGCDMRNIERVVLWGLPPTFCALVQRAGRAARDLSKDGEAILIVSKGVRQQGVSEEDIIANVDATNHEGEAQNIGDVNSEEIRNTGEPTDAMLAGGERQETGDDVEMDNRDGGAVLPDEDVGGGGERVSEGSSNRRSKPKGERASHEARFLVLFANTHSCLRKVWDTFFDNKNKTQLSYGENTLFCPRTSTRCCHNCQPELFPMEEISLTRGSGLKRGRKKELPLQLVTMIRGGLEDWREELFDNMYPDGTMCLSPAVVMSDAVIEAIATCGQLLRSFEDIRGRTRWVHAYNNEMSGLSPIGQQLLEKLSEIYAKFENLASESSNSGSDCDNNEAVPDQAITHAPTTAVPPSSFYASSMTSRGARGRGRGPGTSRSRGRGQRTSSAKR